MNAFEIGQQLGKVAPGPGNGGMIQPQAPPQVNRAVWAYVQDLETRLSQLELAHRELASNFEQLTKIIGEGR